MGKKIGILFGITAVLVFGIVFAGNYSKSQSVHVETIILQQVSEENTVTCTGKVENSKQKKVYVTQGAVAQEIYVEEGQRIEKGDVLMSVKVPVEQEPQEDSASSDAIDVDALSNLYGLNANQSQQLQQYLDNSSQVSGKEEKESLPAQSTFQEELVQVTAPVSGVISAVNVKDQEAIGSQPAAVISESAGLQVNLSVNESQISSIAVGQKAEITGVGFQGKRYTGTVSKISNIAQQVVSATGQETIVTVIVKVDSDNKESLEWIKNGFTAKCKIITSVDKDRIVVPYEAVLADENGKEYVYRVLENRTVKTYITTGKEFENGFEVVKGLSQGEEIVLSPEQVSDFQRVLRDTQKAGNADVG